MPSKRSLELSADIIDGQRDALVIAIAMAMDKHTAEALADTMRVVEMAEKGFRDIVRYDSWIDKVHGNHQLVKGKYGTIAADALAAIAKLKEKA